MRIHGQTHKTPLELFEQEKLRLKPRPLTAKEGRYFHDYRTSNMGVDYEYVELKMPVELAKVEAWVNLYAGRAANVRGTVVIFYAGKSYYGEFKIAATSGNAGKDSQSRSSSVYWTRLDLLRIVGFDNLSQESSKRD